MTAKGCPSRETLHQYSLGLLAAGDRDALDSHLDSCPDCQAAIATLDDADDTLIGRLRTPLSSEAVIAEPQLQDALTAAIAGAAAVGASVGAAVKLPPQQPREFPSQQAADLPETLGEYRILKELGRGGMGRVFKALHTKLDRVVAIKVLPHGRGGDQRAIDRFAREMRAVGPLMHPNIVQAYDAREIDGAPVLVMEFVDGLDLAEIVRRLGPLPVADACELARQTALALQCAHEHGLVHRDVKPSNVMLARSGEVKLLDLGLARVYAEGGASVGAGKGDSPHLCEAPEGPFRQMGTVPFSGPQPAGEEMTAAGQAMGTADYMAPEQASDSRGVDIRADLYSLGCTLYKLLSGRAPFSGPECRTTLEKFNAHAQQPPAAIRRLVADVPEGLAVLLDRLLAKNPADRPATPAEVAEALARWCAGTDLPALLQRAIAAEHSPHVSGQGQSAGDSAPQPLAAGQRWRSLVAVAVAMFLLGGGLGFYLGITIRIQKDGRSYEVEVPPDSHTTVSENGSATISLRSAAKSAMRPATKNAAPPAIGAAAEARPLALNDGPMLVADAAAELKALQGQWTVVQIVKEEAADKAWGAGNSDFTKIGGRFVFHGQHLAIPQLGRHGYFSAYECSVGSSAVPRWIDLYAGAPERRDLFALGTYQLDGGRLKVCLAHAMGRPVGSFARPEALAVAPSSGNVLLTLERYRPSADETELQQSSGWSVVTQIEDGKVLRDDQSRTWGGEFKFTEYNAFYYGTHYHGLASTDGWQYILDPKKSPKTISLITLYRPKEERLSGIYRFDGDRLTLAFRPGEKPPEKFESTPGSGVTLFVLQGSNTRAVPARRAGTTPGAYGLKPPTSQPRSSQPAASIEQPREMPPIVVPVGPQRPGPRVGWLAGCAGVELLAIGDGRRWWQPSGVPLAGPPCPMREAPPSAPEPDFSRRAFFVRVTGVPLDQWGTNFQVVPSSGSDDRIAYQDIQRVPSRSYFSGVEAGVPNDAKTVTLRWGFSMGPWEDAALAAFTPEGRPIGPGSWGEQLNSLQVLRRQDQTEIEMSYQSRDEERAIVIFENRNDVTTDFHRSRGKMRAEFHADALTPIKAIKLQRRPYAWGEFQGVPTQWSETPIRMASVSPDTCNVAAQSQGPWIARLSNGMTVVQLVGVGDEDRWWQPNGAALAKPPCQFDSGTKSDDKGLVRRRFFLSVSSALLSSQTEIAGGISPGTIAAIPERVRRQGREVDNGVKFLAFEAFVPKTSHTITAVTCGVATGPWQEFASPSVNYYPGPGGYCSGGESIGSRNIWLQIHKQKDGVEAVVTDGWFNTDDLRLVAITYDGRALTGRAWIDHPKRQQVQTIIRATFPGVTLAEIKKLNVERRPYEWVCFSYVAAVPETAAKLETAAPHATAAAARKP